MVYGLLCLQQSIRVLDYARSSRPREFTSRFSICDAKPSQGQEICDSGRVRARLGNWDGNGRFQRVLQSFVKSVCGKGREPVGYFVITERGRTSRAEIFASFVGFAGSSRRDTEPKPELRRRRRLCPRDRVAERRKGKSPSLCCQGDRQCFRFLWSAAAARARNYRRRREARCDSGLRYELRNVGKRVRSRSAPCRQEFFAEPAAAHARGRDAATLPSFWCSPASVCADYGHAGLNWACQ